MYTDFKVSVKGKVVPFLTLVSCHEGTQGKWKYSSKHSQSLQWRKVCNWLHTLNNSSPGRVPLYHKQEAGKTTKLLWALSKQENLLPITWSDMLALFKNFNFTRNLFNFFVTRQAPRMKQNFCG